MDAVFVNEMINAAEGAEWSVLAGCILLVAVWLLRRSTSKMPPLKWQPLLNATVGLVSAVAVLLVADVVWYRALAEGLLVGAAAGGFWSMLGKYILPKVS